MAWTRKLPSGRWQGLYRDPSGRVRSAGSAHRGGSFQRKGDAEIAAEEEEARMRRGQWTDPALARTRFDKWAEHFVSTTLNQRPTTRARDESYLHSQLLPAFGGAQLGAIEPTDVQEWVARLAERRAPGTVGICYRLLARILKAAEESGYIGQSPCRAVTLPRLERSEMRFLTAGELETLAATVPERYRALVLSAGYLGLRWGEACGLKRRRVNLLRGSLEVSEILVELKGELSFGEPKTAASKRTLSIPPFLTLELERHLENHSTHPELIFAGRDGGPLRRNNFRRRVWLPAVQEAGLEPLTFHGLRHTAAALLIGAGAHPKLIQSRLGHSSIAVTLDRYGHLMPTLDARVADDLEAAHLTASAELPAAHMLHAD